MKVATIKPKYISVSNSNPEITNYNYELNSPSPNISYYNNELHTYLSSSNLEDLSQAFYLITNILKQKDNKIHQLEIKINDLQSQLMNNSSKKINMQSTNPSDNEANYSKKANLEFSFKKSLDIDGNFSYTNEQRNNEYRITGSFACDSNSTAQLNQTDNQNNIPKQDINISANQISPNKKEISPRPKNRQRKRLSHNDNNNIYPNKSLISINKVNKTHLIPKRTQPKLQNEKLTEFINKENQNQEKINIINNSINNPLKINNDSFQNSPTESKTSQNRNEGNSLFLNMVNPRGSAPGLHSPAASFSQSSYSSVKNNNIKNKLPTPININNRQNNITSIKKLENNPNNLLFPTPSHRNLRIPFQQMYPSNRTSPKNSKLANFTSESESSKVLVNSSNEIDKCKKIEFPSFKNINLGRSKSNEYMKKSHERSRSGSSSPKKDVKNFLKEVKERLNTFLFSKFIENIRLLTANKNNQEISNEIMIKMKAILGSANIDLFRKLQNILGIKTPLE